MTDPRCGTVAGYQAHRTRHEPACQPCKDGWADWHRAYDARVYLARGLLQIDATGTRRRIRALMWMGWSQESIGRQLGVTSPAVRGWLRGRSVLRTTAGRVAELYDRLWCVPGPNVKAHHYAAARGWPSPLAWDDDEIDDPAARPRHDLRGDVPGHPRNTDREEQVMHLTRAGLSAGEIALRLKTNKRYVTRVRARHRTEGEVA